MQQFYLRSQIWYPINLPKGLNIVRSNCRASVGLRLHQAKTEQFLPDSKFHELSIATDIQFMVVTFQVDYAAVLFTPSDLIPD